MPRTTRGLIEFKCWSLIADGLRASADVYEGGEDNPSFAAVVDALVLPLHLATDNPRMLRVAAFVKEWTALLDAFCHRASLITPGKKCVGEQRVFTLTTPRLGAASCGRSIYHRITLATSLRLVLTRVLL